MARKKYRGKVKQLLILVLALGLILGLILVLALWLILGLILGLILEFMPELLVLVIMILVLTRFLVQQKPWEKLKNKVPSTRIKTSLIARILPEEYRADLNTLRHRWIVKQKLPRWLVNMRTCLFLLVVFKSWLQIKLESLFLPNNRSS